MTKLRTYCTYFDSRYLPRAIALYRSLQRHDGDFCLHALCFDDAAYTAVSAMSEPNFKPISLDEFLVGDPALSAARTNRSQVEFYFTCSPSLPLYLFKKDPQLDQVTYLDADLYFFDRPKLVFDEIGRASIAIIPHRFPPYLRRLESTGTFNVGWLSFRQDEEGLACLNRWRGQCLEWCFDRLEDGRFGDQGYLNEWPRMYNSLAVVQQKGANLAPWNVGGAYLSLEDGKVKIDGDPLVFYHFQSLARVARGVYRLNFRKFQTRPGRLLREYVYRPHVRELESIYASQPNAIKDERVRMPTDLTSIFKRQNDTSLRRLAWLILKTLRDMLIGDYIFSVGKGAAEEP